MNLHVSALGFDAMGKWVAVRLADGGSDGTLYDSKAAAIRHQAHEQMCAYIRIPPGGMNVCQAESFMRMNRKAYDAGFRLSDPDRQIIPRLTRTDHAAQMARLSR